MIQSFILSKSLQNDPTKNLRWDSDYTNLLIETMELISNTDYETAQTKCSECLKIATQLNDSFKIHETKWTLSVILFHQTKSKDAIDTLLPVVTSLNSQSENALFDWRQMELTWKCNCNWALFYLGICHSNESLQLINNSISLISKEINPERELRWIKNMSQLLFGIETWVNNDDPNMIIRSGDWDDNIEEHKKIIKHLILTFNRFLYSNNIEEYIAELGNIKESMESIKDYNGVIFAIFNEQGSIFIKESNDSQRLSKEGQNAKLKISAWLQAISEHKDKKGLDGMIIDKWLQNFKDKMGTAGKIYQIWLNKENEVRNNLRRSNIGNDPDISSINPKKHENNNVSIAYMKLLISYAINYIGNNIADSSLQSQLINQLVQTQTLLEENKIDLRNIKFNTLDPEISKAINIWISNLITIYRRQQLLSYFTKYSHKVKAINKANNELRLKNFFKDSYLCINNGNKIIKINYTSGGFEFHWYQFSTQGGNDPSKWNDQILVFKKGKAKENADQVIPFNSIWRILVGFKSANLKKKMKKLPNQNTPWTYISLWVNGRSVDWYFDDETVCNNWFYGFTHWCDQSQSKYKIISVSGYVLWRLKMKMVYENKLGNANESFTKVLWNMNKMFSL